MAATAATAYVRHYCERRKKVGEKVPNNSISRTGNRKGVAAVAAVHESIMPADFHIVGYI